LHMTSNAGNLHEAALREFVDNMESQAAPLRKLRKQAIWVSYGRLETILAKVSDTPNFSFVNWVLYRSNEEASCASADTERLLV